MKWFYFLSLRLKVVENHYTNVTDSEN